ncbi:amino acid racemase [Christensenellaceae bacterium OttesenSCG-928-M15]|nr:amino acid racemase [Christensenellaceae bacterium OttesenSCG-928-M15]
MKKLGLVGGVGPASTVEYYKGINEGYQKRLNRPSKSGENPPMLIDSLNLSTAYDLVERKDWESFTKLFTDSIHRLARAGAEFAAISANTAHIVFDDIQAQSPIPVIGIVDETCKYAQARGCKKLIVFGTGFTMNSGMYETKCAQYGITAIVPTAADQQAIHDIIFPNLEAGIVLEEEKAVMLEIAKRMLDEHQADALVLGCTELPLIIQEGDLNTNVLDTTNIHIEAILKHILR